MATNGNNYWNYQQGYTQPVIGSNVNASYQQQHAPLPPSHPPPPPPGYPVNYQAVPPTPVAPYPVNSSPYGGPIQGHTTTTQYQQPQNTYYYNPQQNVYPPTTSPAGYAPPPPPPPPSHLNNNQNQTTNSPSCKTINKTSNNKTEQNKYTCQPCSITFESHSAYSAHTKAHIQCSYPGCTFKASKKVVGGHYASQHGKYSGRGLKTVTIQPPGSKRSQRFKICVGNHPEDIEAWIKERKKRFPTKERILKLEEKKRRREGGGGTDGKNEEEGSVGKKRCLDKTNASVVSDNRNSDSAIPKRDDVLPNSKMLDNPKSIQKESSPQDSALSNLLCYGSSSSDDDDGDGDGDGDEANSGGEEKKMKPTIDSSSSIKEHFHMKGTEGNSYTTLSATNSSLGIDDKKNNDNNNKYKTKHCRYFVRNGSCKNGDKCTYIHDIAQHEAYKANRAVQREMQSKRDKAKNEAQREMNLLTTGKANGGSGNGTMLPATGQTLLRKLLQNDIRRERMLTLQLLRYIVDCNFLQEKRELKDTNDNNASSI